MPSVDFYILDETSAHKSLLFVCQLCEEAYIDKQQVFVYTDSQTEAKKMDALLWTYKDISFVPHCLCESQQAVEPIHIGYEQSTCHHQEILINCTTKVPSFYTQFKRVIEIVFSDPPVQQLARERFKYYRDQGCNITTHKMKVPA